MLLEIIIGLLVAVLILYVFYQYLLWAPGYRSSAEFDEAKKASILYKILPPTSLTDSRKYVYFWGTYYWMKNTL
jgi:hypothetical protein